MLTKGGSGAADDGVAAAEPAAPAAAVRAKEALPAEAPGVYELGARTSEAVAAAVALAVAAAAAAAAGAAEALGENVGVLVLMLSGPSLSAKRGSATSFVAALADSDGCGRGALKVVLAS